MVTYTLLVILLIPLYTIWYFARATLLFHLRQKLFEFRDTLTDMMLADESLRADRFARYIIELQRVTLKSLGNLGVLRFLLIMASESEVKSGEISLKTIKDERLKRIGRNTVTVLILGVFVSSPLMIPLSALGVMMYLRKSVRGVLDSARQSVLNRLSLPDDLPQKLEAI